MTSQQRLKGSEPWNTWWKMVQAGGTAGAKALRRHMDSALKHSEVASIGEVDKDKVKDQKRRGISRPQRKASQWRSMKS